MGDVIDVFLNYNMNDLSSILWKRVVVALLDLIYHFIHSPDKHGQKLRGILLSNKCLAELFFQTC